MSERTLKQLVGALVVVVVLWGIATLLSGGDGAPSVTGEIADFFDGVDEDAVSAVRLSGTGGAVELTRDAGAWRVNGFASDSGTVTRFWQALESAGVGGIAATNPQNHDRLGVSEDSAAWIEIDVDGATRRLLVGRQGARFGTVYGRIPGEDEAYLLDADLRLHVIRRLSDWRDKRMVMVDTSAVQRLDVSRDGESYTLVRADSAWTLEAGDSINATAVRNILSELSGLLASDFLAEDDSLAALEQGSEVVAYAGDGVVLARVSVGSGDADRWGRAEGNPVLYRLPSYRVDRVTPPRERVAAGG